MLYAMFERSKLFHTVLSISPAAHWDDRVLLKQEEAFAATHPVLNTRVWLSYGELEWPHFPKTIKALRHGPRSIPPSDQFAPHPTRDGASTMSSIQMS